MICRMFPSPNDLWGKVAKLGALRRESCKAPNFALYSSSAFLIIWKAAMATSSICSSG